MHFMFLVQDSNPITAAKSNEMHKSVEELFKIDREFGRPIPNSFLSMTSVPSIPSVGWSVRVGVVLWSGLPDRSSDHTRLVWPNR